MGNISEDKKLEILHDHYKDSFSYLYGYIKQREKLFVFVLVVIFLQFLQISFSDQYIEAFNAFIEQKINFNFLVGKGFLNNILWFLLFSISLRYFQTNVLINRQYDYLHGLEERICTKTGEEKYISREGKQYLENYPLFSDWVHFVYTWIFPILLILVSLTKITLEIFMENKCSFSLLMGGIFFVAVLVTTILYLLQIHKGK